MEAAKTVDQAILDANERVVVRWRAVSPAAPGVTAHDFH